MIITVVWKHCFSMDNIIITKSYCPGSPPSLRGIFLPIGRRPHLEHSVHSVKRHFLPVRKGSWGMTGPYKHIAIIFTMAQQDPLCWADCISSGGWKFFCLWCLERMLCWAHPGLMASGRAQGNWLGLGMVRGTVKLVKKNASISTQSASCVYVCWITNCLLSQHRSSESVLWSFVWVVDTVVTYRASVAVINLSSGEFHSLCSFSKIEICVSPSLLDQTIHSVESLGLIFFSLKPEFVIWV